MEGVGERGEKRETRTEWCCVYVLTSYKEYKHYVLQTCDNIYYYICNICNKNSKWKTYSQVWKTNTTEQNNIYNLVL